MIIRAKKIFFPRLILSIFFLGIIYYSGITSFMPGKFDNRTEENRKFAKIPEFNLKEIKDYPGKFEIYFNDNFGLRNSLIRFQHWYKINLLKVSPSNKVIIGKDGWLYYARTVHQHESPRYFRNQDLEAWKYYFINRMNYLQSKGIQYFFVVVPDKISIYPDHIPRKYFRENKKTALDQFLQYLKENLDLNVVDLRSVLLNSKKKYPLYHKTGTHWNDIGGYLGYHEVLQKISLYFENISPLEFYQFKVNICNSRGMDLAGMIDQRNQMRENEYRVVPQFNLHHHKKVLADYLDTQWPQGWRTPYLITDEEANGTLVVIGDSFFIGPTVNFSVLIAQHFKKTFFIHRKYLSRAEFEKMIDMETPGIVIEEIVERNILAIPKI